MTSRRIRDHVRNQWAGLIALFLVFASGTAYAVDGPLAGTNTVGSEDIINNDVKSADIADGRIFNVDLADNLITGQKLKDDSITGADISEDSLGRVPTALLGGFGRTGSESSGCDPESTTFVNCALAGPTIVPAGARALVLGRVQAQTELDSERGYGECYLATSTLGAIQNTRVDIDVEDGQYEASAGWETVTTMGVSPTLPPGPTYFGIDCNQETRGAVKYGDAAATMVLITAN